MSGGVNIDELERLLEKATGGECRARPPESELEFPLFIEGTIIADFDFGDDEANRANVELFAALRNAAPDLIAEIKRLREALEPFATMADVMEAVGIGGEDQVYTIQHAGGNSRLLGRHFEAAKSAATPPGDTP